MMQLFGFLTATVAVPGTTSIAIPAQWVLFGLTLPFVMFLPARMTAAHWFGGAFIVYALGSWMAHKSYDGLWELYTLFILAFAFWLGTVLVTLRPLIVGLIAGMAVSSTLAMLQWYDYSFEIWRLNTTPAGLFFNQASHGMMLALVIVAGLCERFFFSTLLLVPGLILSQSRGAWLVLIVGALATVNRVFVGILLIAAVGVFGIVVASVGTVNLFKMLGQSDIERITNWIFILNDLTPFGRGPGSYQGFKIGDIVVFGMAHNDYLQLIYQYGIGAIFAFAVYALTLARSGGKHWPIFVSFSVGSLFFFPLFIAPIAFVGCMVAGHLARRDYVHVANSGIRRPSGLSRVH